MLAREQTPPPSSCPLPSASITFNRHFAVKDSMPQKVIWARVVEVIISHLLPEMTEPPHPPPGAPSPTPICSSLASQPQSPTVLNTVVLTQLKLRLTRSPRSDSLLLQWRLCPVLRTVLAAVRATGNKRSKSQGLLSLSGLQA